MKINIGKSSGFCFGVRRAIDICLALDGSKKPVYVLGEIVHNNFVVNELAQKGIHSISFIRPAKTKGSILIISAHGASRSVFERARKCGYRVIDATCPKVKDIYKVAKRLERNNRLIIIGDKGHGEVKGIAGQLKKPPLIIESAESISLPKLRNTKKIAAITQSTQSEANIRKIMKKLQSVVGTDVKLYNTTCKITGVKQRELMDMADKNGVILIVGSPTSANTKRLYEISSAINQNTYWIDSAKDLDRKFFKKARSVGIMAGASTPDIVVEEIVGKIQKS
ncbi:MAG TPA: 4-hydroxy-3-methylbut-2-enyl diphosphate reductase [Candidatus Omnitrophota bacterium]|nr:4-hydroxy-3-methylbut-2-enyl diphosphate reductase [Candidatus Omnitrophota bacterium]HPS19886.1 4-hydroxy-3-methylbut-2-enyl diphosphate reductase [Candidatus Omnitrophota bacterium]